jgi:hypothetical protein
MPTRKPIPDRVRFKIYERDRFTCQYCGESAPNVILQIDHKTPHSKGGSDEEGNLLTACRECNQGKSDNEYSGHDGGVPQRRGKKHPLVGRALHSFADGKVKEQGMILDVVPTGTATGDLALVLYFDWIIGEPNYQRAIPVSAFAYPSEGKTYRLYSNLEEANAQYEHNSRSKYYDHPRE